MSGSHNETLVRDFYKYFHARDRAAFENLMLADFTFTSPYDDHIDQKAYFTRCWPNGDVIKDFTIDKSAVNGNTVFIHYHALGKGGKPFHNVEIFTVKNDRIASVEVYFGEPTTQADKINDKAA